MTDKNDTSEWGKPVGPVVTLAQIELENEIERLEFEQAAIIFNAENIAIGMVAAIEIEAELKRLRKELAGIENDG